MIRCTKCGEHSEKFVLRTIGRENWRCCPYCGSTEIEEVGECRECGQPCDQVDVLCDDCKTYVRERLLNDINETFTHAEREFIWLHWEDVSREELNLGGTK